MGTGNQADIPVSLSAPFPVSGGGWRQTGDITSCWDNHTGSCQEPPKVLSLPCQSWPQLRTHTQKCTHIHKLTIVSSKLWISCVYWYNLKHCTWLSAWLSLPWCHFLFDWHLFSQFHPCVFVFWLDTHWISVPAYTTFHEQQQINLKLFEISEIFQMYLIKRYVGWSGSQARRTVTSRFPFLVMSYPTRLPI